MLKARLQIIELYARVVRRDTRGRVWGGVLPV